MPRAERVALRFVRAVIAGAEPRAGEGDIEAAGVVLPATELRELVALGVLEADGRPRQETRTWLRRQLLEVDPLAAQHRTEVSVKDGVRINLDESPLARLATGTDPFLARHQVEAGERVRRLCERARLQPRVTMSYSGAHTAGGKGASQAQEITDLAADARRQLATLHQALPADCAGVVFDVCGLLKGLQQVEAERGWPRRSAKLVLRIGLEQAATCFGLAGTAEGKRRTRAWGERPTVVG